jgi:curli biogenesis system outer membrane secretion channel CsgG
MQFKRALSYVALVLSLAFLCPQARSQANPQKKRVAILNFEDDTGGSTAASEVFGAATGSVGQGVSAQLIEKLTSGGKYTVVDRSELKSALEQQNNSEASATDAYGMAAKVGGMLSLDAMVIGAITRFGPDAAPKDGAGHSVLSTRKSKAYLDITARVLDMTSGQVIAEFTASGESAGSGDVTRIKARGHSNGPQDMLSSEFAGSLLAEATRNAVEQIAAQLNSYAEKIPVLRIEINGLVAEVSGNSLTLNLGKKSGVRVGDKLAIFREVAAASDPQTAGPSSPGSKPSMEQAGEVTVTEVTDAYAAATFSGSGRVQAGDRVKSLPNPQLPPH